MRLGTIHALVRLSVKGMASERLEGVAGGWDGAEGDRRHAVVRSDDRGVVPAGDPVAVL